MTVSKTALADKKTLPKFDLFDWAELQNTILQPLHIRKLVIRLGISPALAKIVAELAEIKGAFHA